MEFSNQFIEGKIYYEKNNRNSLCNRDVFGVACRDFWGGLRIVHLEQIYHSKLVVQYSDDSGNNRDLMYYSFCNLQL